MIVDTVLAQFRDVVRPIIKSGRSVNIDACLEKAISGTRFELRDISMKEIRQRIWPEEENIRSMCQKIIVEMEKRGRLLDIRKTSIAAILDEFIERSGLEMTYKLRDNSSVGLCFRIPSTRQYLIVNTSFSKMLSSDWLERTGEDVKKFIAISQRLERMKVSWHELE